MLMTGRNRRLAFEYEQIMLRLKFHSEISIQVISRNAEGFPNGYLVEYDIHSICGIDSDKKPLFADRFLLRLDIPSEYPSVDAQPSFCFLTSDPVSGVDIPHPWHPNIRYFGDMAGRVCLNAADTYTELAWGILRIGEYLRYERYHALNEPPFPEDQQVAAWVVRIGEPNDYIYF